VSDVEPPPRRRPTADVLARRPAPPVSAVSVSIDALAMRPGSILGVLVVAVIVGLAVVREFVVPGANPIGGLVDLLDTSPLQPNLLRPAGLLVTMAGDLVLLSVLARALDGRGWWPTWHVVAGGTLSIALGTLYAVAVKWCFGNHATLGHALISGPIGGVQTYALWLLAFRYPQVANDARVRALEAEQLRRAAELSRLREHLQPHFLRNTLNAIAAAVHDDPDEARELLAALGDLLSDSLDHERPTQTLAEETAWLRRYSEIFAVRHRGALRFAWDLDPDAEGVELPRLLLQPLVENAIRHGALARPEGGEVRVATRRTGAGVTLVIQDNGPGVVPGRPEGLGLHLVRRRLAIECSGASLHIESSTAGTRAVVELR